jgi:hypothetical protein
MPLPIRSRKPSTVLSLLAALIGTQVVTVRWISTIGF